MAPRRPSWRSANDQYLAVFLAVMTALTVFIISASYAEIIDLFPSGGGGYLVATKLLGPYPGLVSGCALVIDYVLTISISIASGGEASRRDSSLAREARPCGRDSLAMPSALKLPAA
jgi:amino acid transporter